MALFCAILVAIQFLPNKRLTDGAGRDSQAPVGDTSSATTREQNSYEEEPKRQVAGAPVPNPGKSEPGGKFENAWILPLDEQNAGQFADKIDPATDRDTYLIEARQSGFLELYVEPKSPLKIHVSLFEAHSDPDSGDKPEGVTTSESFEGHEFCQMARDVAKGDRLYLRVESQLGKFQGNYEIKVRSVKVDKHVTPPRVTTQDSRPGPPLEANALMELEESFETLQAQNWPDYETDQFRHRLIALCKTHRGQSETRKLAKWLVRLPPPKSTNGNLKWVDFTLPESQSERLRVPPQGTLIVRHTTNAEVPKRFHIIEGWRPGSLAIQFIPFEDETGGFGELNWSKGSDTFGHGTAPPYCAYHDIIGSAPHNQARLRVSIKRNDDTLTGEYLLLLWQPEEPATSDSSHP